VIIVAVVVIVISHQKGEKKEEEEAYLDQDSPTRMNALVPMVLAGRM